MIWHHLRRRMRIQQAVAGLAGLLLGLLVNLASNWVAAAGWYVQWLLIAIVLRLLASSAWYLLLELPAITLRVQPPQVLRLTSEKERQARQGIVVVVSYYIPQRQNRALQLTPDERLAAAQQLDYQGLDLMHSNLAPAIDAILTHASRLRHCWLIGTSGTNRRNRGSSDFIPVLVEYLRGEHGLQCDFHYGSKYELALEDDA